MENQPQFTILKPSAISIHFTAAFFPYRSDIRSSLAVYILFLGFHFTYLSGFEIWCQLQTLSLLRPKEHTVYYLVQSRCSFSEGFIVQILSKQYCLPTMCVQGYNSAVWLGLQGKHCVRLGKPSDVNMGSFTKLLGRKKILIQMCLKLSL